MYLLSYCYVPTCFKFSVYIILLNLLEIGNLFYKRGLEAQRGK